MSAASSPSLRARVGALLTAPVRVLWGGGLAARALLAYAVAYVGWLLFVPKDDAGRLWSGWLVLPMSLAPALLAWRAGGRATAPPSARRAWRLLALAFAATCAGDLAWAWVETVRRADPSTSWANAPYFLYYPLTLAALFSFPIERRSRADARLSLLDAAAVVLGGGLVAYRFLLYPNLERVAGAADLLPLAYPIGDLVTLVGLARILIRRPSGAPPLAMDLLAAGILLNTVGNALWAALDAYGVYQSAGLSDALWAVSYLVLAAGAAHAAYAAPCARVETPEEAGGDARPRRVLLATLGLAWALLVFAAVDRLVPAALLPVCVGTVLLTAVVIARQTLAARERLRDLADRSMRQSTALFRSLVQSSSDAVLVLEPDGVVRYASPAAFPLFAAGHDRLEGRSILEALGEDQRPLLSGALRDTLGGQPAVVTEIRVPRAGGDSRVVDCRLSDLRADPTVRGLVVRARDVSDYHAERGSLFRKAFYDELTDLPRRELLRDRIVQALRVRRRGLLDVAVLFVDLDDFKGVNDRLGHAVGDEVLRGVASRLSACVRDGDSAARVGGDEFAVLLSDRVAEADVVAVAARIVRAFGTPIPARGREVVLGASVGVAIAREADTADALLRRADRAMYEAKRRGGRQWILHTPSLAAAHGERSTDF
jgi:diguanylate cyclase (GGDEF)-like protein/PAS domain S-box-containing protein